MIPSKPRENFWRVPCPDVYRGPHKDPNTAGKLYANYVKEACDTYKARGEAVAAFIMESGMSVAGVVLPPEDYLKYAVKSVWEARGVFIADEVQTGVGRFGTSSWAFQQSNDGVIPDIITMGKPFGNGMPLAAVLQLEVSQKLMKLLDQNISTLSVVTRFVLLLDLLY